MSSLNLRRMKSFATFDLPINYKYIYLQFQKKHEHLCSSNAVWPVTATRHKLISNYWEHVMLHYLTLVGLSSLFVALVSSSSFLSSSIISFVVGALTYIPLYYIIYRPTFNGDFLPKLEAVMTAYEGKQRAWMEKCKQDQLGTRSLVLLFYVLDKTSKLNYLYRGDKYADLLHRIFGVSPDGVKKELSLIFKKGKGAKLGPRAQVEISKSFEETYNLIETMQFTEGAKVLRELELRLIGS